VAAVVLGVATASTTNNANYTTGSFTPAADDLLVSFVVVTGNTNTGSLSDSLSGTWEHVGSYAKAASADRLHAFVRVTPATASAMTATWTRSGATSGGIVTVLRVSGMSRYGLDAVRQFQGQSNQSAATPAPAFDVAALTGNPCLGFVANATNPAGMTEPGSWTERSDTGYNTPTTGSEVASRDSGFTGTTVTWGSSSASAFGSMIIELDASVPVLVLAGTATGTATASGDAAVLRALTGTAAGEATATGALSVSAGGTTWELVGTATGTATATGSVEVTRALAGSAAGEATATGSVEVTRALAGTAEGVATSTGALSVGAGGTTWALVGTAAGVGTATGDALVTRALAGLAAGVGVLSGELEVTGPGAPLALQGTATGTATATGSVLLSMALSGSATGEATGTAGLSLSQALAGLLAGVGAATGALRLVRSEIVTATTASVALYASTASSPFGGASAAGPDTTTTATASLRQATAEVQR